ncbi:hypothetical protein [Corynebacterium heidelbergense]|uniref:Uncharacterized protein n=1 Tax=Corynebacterium heidelbergense TaxID=2055947 RepID=A0A364VC78_9CORY|nr:hypothetical protein [Corynebacterium heidelbergense]RAV34262.1 hypothetical protein CWC39_04215 [Corynebacterium heidelbergense]WCZ36966.1 hypothetical protein CHEID_07165 [Corynebacterium heidelbergense]
MAITALATSNTTIGPAQYADMSQILTARFKVDSPNDLRPSAGSSRTVSVSSGAGFAGGTRIRSTGTETISCDSQSSGSRWDAIVIRIDWSSATQRLAVVKGTSSTVPVNTSSAPNTAQINRIPGVLYDALVCVVQVNAGSTTVANLTDYRTWGGDGGPLRVTDAALSSPSLLDARPGTWIATDQGKLTKRLDDDGVWRSVGTQSNPWKLWTPTLRFYGTGVPNGTSGGTVAGLGNGGSASGRYRIVDGLLDGYIYVQPGSTGATYGDGPMTVDLPMACASWQEDTWSMGHLFTFGYGGDGNYDWHAELLVKKGWNRGQMFTNARIDDARLWPYQCQRPNGGPGSGTPFIANGYPVGTWTFHVTYPVDV